jgi:hypothetical protein
VHSQWLEGSTRSGKEGSMAHIILYGIISALSVGVIVMARQRRTVYAVARQTGMDRSSVR